MWLPWEYAVVLAALCVGVAWRTQGQVAAVATESATLSALYALWQLAGQLSVMQIDGAIERGQWIWDFQQAIYLPSELATQNLIIDSSLTVQAANIYYGGAHVPGMGVFLLWLFFRHRDHYARWRSALALTTGICLLIQLFPVAPPRLVPDLGMVDTGLAYGQSVYEALGGRTAGQLQAMPSIHVAWAALIAWATWRLGDRIAKTVGACHGVLTILVVTVTANHFWLDGIVAIMILMPVYWLLAFAYRKGTTATEPVSTTNQATAPIG